MKNHLATILCLAFALTRAAHAAPAGEPTNAKEAAEKKIAQDKRTDELYQQKFVTLSPERQAWEKVLQENLGNGFYLPAHKRDFVAGRSTAWDFVADDPRLPRVLIIGDSISRGYTMATRSALAGKANVHRAPENCGPTANGLKKVDTWLGQGKWDVITWNFGIHDRNTPPATYKANLETLVKRLQQTGAKIIWVRTTPAPAGTNNEKFTDAQCDFLNATADEVMKANHVSEVDLFALVKPKLAELQLTNNVHFKEEGYQLMGGEMAKAILGVAKKSGAK